MRIITVTMNPAIDRTVTCDTFEIGATNRITNSIENIAGKGINVSNTLKELGLSSEVLGVFAGKQGMRCIQDLELKKHPVHAFFGEGETRLNQKIVDGKGITTELNEKGPRVSAETLDKIGVWIEKNANANTLFVLAGSLPQGVSTHYYYDLVLRIKEQGGM